MSPTARPSVDDPLVASASEVVGGPVGRHAAPHPWWTPVRVVLAVACVAFCLALVQKAPCGAADWSGGNERYAQMCYSDLPYLYAGRGLAEREYPYAEDAGRRHQAMEYPVLISWFAWGSALATHAVSGWPDVAARADLPPEEVGALPEMAQERDRFFLVSAVLLAPFALLAAWFLAGAHPGRPWDAMLLAASPVLVLTALINWDLVAVAAVAGALWAWARGRPLLSGVLVGLGTAAKLYPALLLGALLVTCLRRRRLRDLAVATPGALLGWLAVNLPALATGPEPWRQFWSFNTDRGADLGSVWLVLQQAGLVLEPRTVNAVSLMLFALACAGILALGLTVRRPPRLAQVAFLVVAAFLLLNKVYSPQYVLWLLPLAVLARPRWRDVLVWQAGEVFYFAAVWLYLGEYTAPAASGEPDRFYWVAIAVRVVAQLYLVAMVVRDMVRPWHDPVRTDGLTDDPAFPEPAGAPSRVS